MFTRIVEEMLIQRRQPDLSTHINSLGPTEWENTGNKIITKNRMVGMAFKSMAEYLTKLEDSPEDWHLSPIRGHTKISKLFPLYPANIATLEVQRITTVSQIFETHLSGRIDKSISPELMTSLTLYPALQHKLKVFLRALLHQPFHNKYSCPRSNLAILANLDFNLSRRYRLKICKLVNSWTPLLGWPQRNTPEFETTLPFGQANETSPTPTISYIYRTSLLKLGKQRFRFSITPFGRTTRRSNPECDRTQTVSVAAKRKPWSTSSVNANTTQSHCGAN